MTTKTTISLLPPTPSISQTYHPTLRSCIQKTSSSSLPPTPQTFLDSMVVRETVFVDEQKVALENEFDDEDPRCWHWVLYAGDSEEGMKPVGTIRLVPFPQQGETPRAGGVYFGGQLVNAEEMGSATTAPDHQDEEPHLSLGRLAVLPAYRGRGFARLLISAALQYAQEHPTLFNVSQPGRDLTWNGLVCIHAQVGAMEMWARNGFQVDESLGRWWEEGMEHVGMYRRCEIAR
ncbi:acyl-CoA N-acyltransferase [Podospora conica]|nr:acyl-CoA N-acyltransferase [Schizothecium conicum]